MNLPISDVLVALYGGTILFVTPGDTTAVSSTCSPGDSRTVEGLVTLLRPSSTSRLTIDKNDGAIVLIIFKTEKNGIVNLE